jgi:hypothetical protein
MIRAREAGLTIGEIPVHFALNEQRSSFVKPAALFEFMSNLFLYRFGGRKRRIEDTRVSQRLNAQADGRPHSYMGRRME